MYIRGWPPIHALCAVTSPCAKREVLCCPSANFHIRHALARVPLCTTIQPIINSRGYSTPRTLREPKYVRTERRIPTCKQDVCDTKHYSHSFALRADQPTASLESRRISCPRRRGQVTVADGYIDEPARTLSVLKWPPTTAAEGQLSLGVRSHTPVAATPSLAWSQTTSTTTASEL